MSVDVVDTSYDRHVTTIMFIVSTSQKWIVTIGHISTHEHAHKERKIQRKHSDLISAWF